MALHFIYGESGSGKSYQLYQRMIHRSLQEEPEGQQTEYVVIVPEQFTMQTQKDIVTMHPHHGVMNIDIVSFERLAFRIWEELGMEMPDILDDTGKCLVLKKVLEDKKEELPCFSSKIGMYGFLAEIKSILAEMYQYDINSDSLDKMMKLGQIKPSLKNKLQDMKVIYDGFRDYLQDNYITSEEILEVLSRYIPCSRIVSRSEFYLDGFTGFTPVQYKVLRMLLRYGKNVYITVTMPSVSALEKRELLFALSQKTADKLKRIAQEENQQIWEENTGEKGLSLKYGKGSALWFLNRNLFQESSTKRVESKNAIMINYARNPSSECKKIVETILKLIKEEGYHYRDIAVVTGDMEGYYRPLEKSFRAKNIPCFIDYKRSLISNPFVEAIRAALEIMQNNYSYESVFRYLKTGISGILEQDVDRLENYVLALGIRGYRKWSTEFTIFYKEMEKEYPVPEEALEQLNRIRVCFMEEMEALHQSVHKRKMTAEEYVRALYQFMVDHSYAHQLTEYEQKFQEKKEYGREKEYSQTYSLILELLDKIVVLLGKQRLSLKEFTEILEAGFEEIKVGVIPPSVDQVVVGDIERTRLNQIKALFFVGVNEGVIPKISSKYGILTERERSFLEENEFELSPGPRETAMIQNFYLYLYMTKPSERLYLSYSQMSEDGKSKRPSFLIHRIEKMYTDISIQNMEERSWQEDFYQKGDGWDLLSSGFEQYVKGSASDAWKEIYNYFYQHEPEPLLRMVENAYYENGEDKLTKIAATGLYGKHLTNSVTRLERYASCAYAHFLQYGLALYPRREYEVKPVDMGNLYHKSLEEISLQIHKRGWSWEDLTDNRRKELVKESVHQIAGDYGNAVFQDNARNQYKIHQIETITERTLWVLGEQLKLGKFTPKHYELFFNVNSGLKGMSFSMPDGESMDLEGKIDRIDVYEEENEVFIKVIDYKSGNKAFQIMDAYLGVQMQLIVYLQAAMEWEKKHNAKKTVIPAGIFYYNIKDEYIEREKLKQGNAQETAEELFTKFKMSGLVNENETIIQALEQEIATYAKTIPVQITKNGLSKRSSTANTIQFENLIQYTNKKIEKMGQEILAGHMERNPYGGTDSPCQYCNYRSVCGFDVRIPGNRYRKQPQIEREELWQKIHEEVQKEDGEEMDNSATKRNGITE